ncbi:MAG: DapH/DapD/GlmU-related protein [Candidatus Helarchaeota archaeon]
MTQISKDAQIGKNVKIRNNVVIEDGAVIGDNVELGYNTIIKENVHIGDNSYIGDNVVLGEYISRFFKNAEDTSKIGYLNDPENYENPPTIIGENAVIRTGTVIYAKCEIGRKLETCAYVVIRYGTKIGDNNYFGNHSELWGNLTIGNHNRFISCVHIGDTSEIGNYCWLFPYAGLATDLHPPCGKCIKGPVVEDYALIGSVSVLLPRIRIGKGAIIGACSLVTKDIPPEMLAMGNPARVIKSIREITCPLGIVDPKDGPYPWYPFMPKDRRKSYGYE